MTGYEPCGGIQLASSLVDMGSLCHEWRCVSSRGGRGGGGGGLRVKGTSGGWEDEGDDRPALARPRSTARGKFTPDVDQTLPRPSGVYFRTLLIHPTRLLLSTETLDSFVLTAETKDRTKGKKKHTRYGTTLQNKAKHRIAYILLRLNGAVPQPRQMIGKWYPENN